MDTLPLLMERSGNDEEDETRIDAALKARIALREEATVGDLGATRFIPIYAWLTYRHVRFDPEGLAAITTAASMDRRSSRFGEA